VENQFNGEGIDFPKNGVGTIEHPSKKREREKRTLT